MSGQWQHVSEAADITTPERMDTHTAMSTRTPMRYERKLWAIVRRSK